MIASSRLIQRPPAAAMAAAAGLWPAARWRNEGRFSRMALGCLGSLPRSARTNQEVRASRGQGIFAEPPAPIASRSWQTAIALRADAEETAPPANRGSAQRDTP